MAITETGSSKSAGLTQKTSADLADTSPVLAVHDSYWTQRNPLQQTYPALDGKHETEVLVIGGGITGLSVALELLDRGRKVTVCESSVVGAGTTGGSSGHLDAHPEMGPKQLVDMLGIDEARIFTQMRLGAIAAIRERGQDHVDVDEVPAYCYTESQSGVDALCDEYDQAAHIGLNVAWIEQVPLSRAMAGYKIRGMGRIDSLAYVLRLAQLFIERGGTIFERTLVSGPTDEHPTSLDASRGEVRFDQVVSAVHCNFTGSQRLYVQTPAYQSYVIAAEVEKAIDDALFWDDADPYHYVRRATGDGLTIMIGGSDHRTGEGGEEEALKSLEAWSRERFPITEIVSRWSAELFESSDGLPFIGKVANKRNVWIATGLSGVGLTLGTASGVMLADLIEGKSHPLEKSLSPARTSLSGVASAVLDQTPALKSYANRVLPSASVNVDALEPGDGEVGKVEGKQVAVCRTRDGCIHQHSAICTHMGGLLQWNPVEETWDCPVHGGRFTADGTRLYGPPESDLSDPSDEFE